MAASVERGLAMRHWRGHNRLESTIRVVLCAGFNCTEWLFVGPHDERDAIWVNGQEHPICAKCKRRLDAFRRSKRKPPAEE